MSKDERKETNSNSDYQDSDQEEKRPNRLSLNLGLKGVHNEGDDEENKIRIEIEKPIEKDKKTGGLISFFKNLFISKKDKKEEAYKDKSEVDKKEKKPGFFERLFSSKRKSQIEKEQEEKEKQGEEELRRIKELFKGDPKELRRAYSALKKNEVLKKTTKEKLENIFIEYGYRDIKITEMSSGDRGINVHFLIVADGKKFHAKTPALAAQSHGTVLNEVFTYNLLSKLGYGAKEQSAIVLGEKNSATNDSSSVSSSSPRIMIITEDLANISSDDKRLRRAKDNRELKEGENGHTGNITPTARKNPKREKDIIHRCCISTIIELLDLHDVEKNYGNMGIRYTEGHTSEYLRKEKPFIFDFLLEGKGVGIGTKIQDLVTTFTREDSFQDNKYFSYESSPKIRQEAFIKLFIKGKNDIDFLDAIKNAAENVKNRFKNDVLESEVKSLEKLENRWMKRCRQYAIDGIEYILKNPAIDISNYKEKMEKKLEELRLENSFESPSKSASSAKVDRFSSPSKEVKQSVAVQ